MCKLSPGPPNKEDYNHSRVKACLLDTPAPLLTDCGSPGESQSPLDSLVLGYLAHPGALVGLEMRMWESRVIDVKKLSLSETMCL